MLSCKPQHSDTSSNKVREKANFVKHTFVGKLKLAFDCVQRLKQYNESSPVTSIAFFRLSKVWDTIDAKDKQTYESEVQSLSVKKDLGEARDMLHMLSICDMALMNGSKVEEAKVIALLEDKRLKHDLCVRVVKKMKKIGNVD